MCNSIFIDKKTLPKAKDGEEVEVMINGVYHTDEDGMRTLEVTKVDGRDVSEETECGCGEDEPELMEQDADDALRIFMIKTNKG